MCHARGDHVVVAVVAVAVDVVNGDGVDGVEDGVGSCLARAGDREISHRPASRVILS